MAARREVRESDLVNNSFLKQTKVNLNERSYPGNTSFTEEPRKSKKKRDPIIRINLKEGISTLLNATHQEETVNSIRDSDLDSSIDSDTSDNVDTIKIPSIIYKEILERINRLEEGQEELKKTIEELTSSKHMAQEGNLIHVKLNDNFSKCVVEMREGNLLKMEPDYVLGHCIAADWRMSDGLAVDIKKMFGDITKQNQNKHLVGSIVQQEKNGKKVLHIITKEESTAKPTWKDFKKAIYKLATRCKEEKISKLALPKLGAGLDGIKWEKIMKVLNYAFKNTTTLVTIVCLPNNEERNFRKRVRNKGMKSRPVEEKTRVQLLGDSHLKGISEILSTESPNSIQHGLCQVRM